MNMVLKMMFGKGVCGKCIVHATFVERCSWSDPASSVGELRSDSRNLSKLQILVKLNAILTR